MINEIETNLEDVKAVRNRRSSQAACGEVERNVPRVVNPRRLREANLADDLRPHVERLRRLLPLRKRQSRPKLIAFVTGNLHLERAPSRRA